ncbi:hypothetical protein D9M72_550950 [compost metagenome]
MVFVGTGGSILVLGLLHGSMNASQGMDTVDWWQFIPAVVVLTAAVAAYLAVRSRTTVPDHRPGQQRTCPAPAADPAAPGRKPLTAI